MTVTGFSHRSVQVRDIEKVLPFYRDLLGLTMSVDREHSFSAPGTATPLQQGIGFDHVSLMADAVVGRVEELGFDRLTGPSNNDGPANAHPGDATVRTALFHDPEGNIIQVDQWLTEKTA
jgi:catechol 2,3-dioxygenase-like lactoylglutathione lyase family enzyme